MRNGAGFVAVLLVAGMVVTAPRQALAVDDPWAAGFLAGYFVPAVEDWETNYDQRGGLTFNLFAGYSLTPRLSVAAEMAYFSASSQAQVGGQQTIESQRFTLIPTTIGLEYRFTFDSDQLIVPFVGAGYRRVSYRLKVGNNDDVTGGANGWVGRGGFDVLLNSLDPSSASGLREDYGVVRSYFRLEAQWAKAEAPEDPLTLGATGEDIDLGGTTFLAGLRFEF